MLRHFLRACLIITLLAVGLSFVEKTQADMSANYPIILIVGMAFLAGVVIVIDILIPRKSLQALVAIFVGLGVGLLISYGITVVVDSLTTAFFPVRSERFSDTITVLKVLLGVISCYYCISFVLQTKDDIRFVIPYVEFSKQVKGNRPLILDTSVIIDGRIVEICETGFIEQTLVVPRFVLHELQAVADSNDKLKRVRGRRGLDVLNALQTKEHVDVEILEPKLSPAEASETVDLKLLALAQQINGRVATNDYNLNKIGQLRGVEILNINDLTNALKPIALPGETMIVKIVKPGEESDQGVGYLDDGTMVVVEQGRNHIGETVNIGVTSMLQTSAGRMIFGRIEAHRTADIRRRAANQKKVASASKK